MMFESVKWIRLAEDRDLWLTLISTMVSLLVSWKVWIFLSSWENIRSLKILHNGVHCTSIKNDQQNIGGTWSRSFYVCYCLGLSKLLYILSDTDNYSVSLNYYSEMAWVWLEPTRYLFGAQEVHTILSIFIDWEYQN